MADNPLLWLRVDNPWPMRAARQKQSGESNGPEDSKSLQFTSQSYKLITALALEC